MAIRAQLNQSFDSDLLKLLLFQFFNLIPFVLPIKLTILFYKIPLFQSRGATANKKHSCRINVYNWGIKVAKEDPKFVARGTARLNIMATL